MEVIWFSRHEMTKAQREGLEKAIGFDDFEITQVNKTISSANEITELVSEKTVCVAAVLPVQLLSDLFDRIGSQVIIAVPRSKRVKDDSGEFQFVHDYWEVVEYCHYKAKRV